MWTSLLYRAKTSQLYTDNTHTSTNLLRYRKNTRTRREMIKWPVGRSFSSFCRCHSNYTKREVFSRGERAYRFFYSPFLSSPRRSSIFKRPVRRPTLIHYVCADSARTPSGILSLSLCTYTYIVACCERTEWEHERIYIYKHTLLSNINVKHHTCNG